MTRVEGSKKVTMWRRELEKERRNKDNRSSVDRDGYSDLSDKLGGKKNAELNLGGEIKSIWRARSDYLG